MKKHLITAALAASVTIGGMAATPAAAQRYGGGYYDGYQRDYRDGYRRDYRDGYRSYRDDRSYRHRYRRCSDGTTGTILGAIAGGLLGGEIGRGSSWRGRSTTGTIIGAGVGALAGREIERGGSNCRR
ncbi:MAG TPA: glycine zipper 2TM domain-containing protein [Sphingomonas sp.]|nr:glycine zipper 2TM domain-containing protein [Sphingomonas sp.]